MVVLLVGFRSRKAARVEWACLFRLRCISESVGRNRAVSGGWGATDEMPKKPSVESDFLGFSSKTDFIRKKHMLFDKKYISFLP